jgi:hypothetical protein
MIADFPKSLHLQAGFNRGSQKQIWQLFFRFSPDFNPVLVSLVGAGNYCHLTPVSHPPRQVSPKSYGDPQR